MDRYYVVQTQPSKERLALQELSNQDYPTFFPVIQRLPVLRKGKMETPRPQALFPKYLFVRLDLAKDRWRSINGTRGVVRLMCMDDESPSPVPEVAMARLLEAGSIIHETRALLPFNLGDSVEFTGGPMAGRQALVEACATDRVHVLLDLLGGRVRVACEPKMLKYIQKT